MRTSQSQRRGPDGEVIYTQADEDGNAAINGSSNNQNALYNRS